MPSMRRLIAQCERDSRALHSAGHARDVLERDSRGLRLQAFAARDAANQMRAALTIWRQDEKGTQQ